MSNKRMEYRLLGIAAADILKNYGKTIVLINTDDMGAALIEVADNGDCAVMDLYQGDAKPDFYQSASESLGIADANETFELCINSKKSFIRYLKTAGSSDEELKGNISCRSLVHIYEKDYRQSVEQVMDAVKSLLADDSNIILVGRMSAFYPVEHTVRSALSPMPFLPLSGLCVNDSLCIGSDELTKRGQVISDRIEKEKKCVCHNVMLRHKRLSGTELIDDLMILAKKGDSFELLKNPKFSDDIIVHALDTIVIQADSTPYSITLPRSLFSMSGPMSRVQFALGIENDIPKLIVKTPDSNITIDLNTSIYTEEE